MVEVVPSGFLQVPETLQLLVSFICNWLFSKGVPGWTVCVRHVPAVFVDFVNSPINGSVLDIGI